MRSSLPRITRPLVSLRPYSTSNLVLDGARPGKMLEGERQEGTIMSVFGTFSGEQAPLPPRFSDLKKQICTDSKRMVETWHELLRELEPAVEEVVEKGADLIPRVPYSDIVRGLTEEQVRDVKKRGLLIIQGGVPEQEALSWKQSIKDYIALNRGQVKGGPPENIIFYEIYNSVGQMRARTHPALIATQRAMLSLWHASPVQDYHNSVSLSTPISYFDRLRIRPPGPCTFSLGPHHDGGSLEQWEDPVFRACFGEIFPMGTSSESWRAHDPFDVTPRLHAKHNIYNAPTQCSVFRPWQGWTSLSHTGPGEGTLRVLPFLHLATAYILLRPFFRPRAGTSSLRAEDWELDLDSTAFPGSVPGKTQELSAETHPHLMLDRTMTSIPRVVPGDQVYWHCDLVHAVESEHNGPGDSSVLYTAAIPLTEYNATYLKNQYTTFTHGLPPSDYPGGEGEALFSGRATPDDVQSLEGRRVVGMEPSEIPAGADEKEAELIRAANAILTA
ncbi:hypothetical protein B0H21DRAFT_141575 [Amylocystis lapponica]|nr:hypothetical protein B0H21DRAFT_141575 [Amylocystis lapponica]